MYSRFLLLSSALISQQAFAVDHFSKQEPPIAAFINLMVDKYDFDQTTLTTLIESVSKRSQPKQQITLKAVPKPWHIYRTIFVNPTRIANGLDFWKNHQAALDRAEKIYGIPASIIVATIGIETNYGRQTGKFKVLDALVNLAFSNNRRASFFRRELKEYLLLSREQAFDPKYMMGSYAGAIGQPQFMPSSFRYYAVDFSHDGHIDLSTNETDIIGSIANYYHKNGWHRNEVIATPISIAGGEFAFNLIRPKPISLTTLVKTQTIPPNTAGTSLIKLQTQYGSEYWLGWHNFNVIKRYNHSNLYAMAVYQLSYYLNLMREQT